MAEINKITCGSGFIKKNRLSINAEKVVGTGVRLKGKLIGRILEYNEEADKVTIEIYPDFAAIVKKMLSGNKLIGVSSKKTSNL